MKYLKAGLRLADPLRTPYSCNLRTTSKISNKSGYLVSKFANFNHSILHLTQKVYKGLIINYKTLVKFLFSEYTKGKNFQTANREFFQFMINNLN